MLKYILKNKKYIFFEHEMRGTTHKSPLVRVLGFKHVTFHIEGNALATRLGFVLKG